MRPQLLDNNLRERERILSESVRDLCSELRLIDLINLVVYVKTESHANIDDLISSSAELFFKPDTLRYAFASDVNLKWGMAPSIAFDMEFRHQGVTIFFSLLLDAVQAGVDIHHIVFDTPETDPEQNNERLIRALQDARQPRR